MIRIIILSLAGLALLALVAVQVRVRTAPDDPALWHGDPLAAPVRAPGPAAGGWVVRPEGGNAAGPVFAATPQELLAALDAIALATPRTTRLAGSVAEGRITYVTRSLFWGFPDYTTVTALAVPGGSTPAIWARQRYGQGDLGVNRARVERWLAALGARLPAS